MTIKDRQFQKRKLLEDLQDVIKRARLFDGAIHSDRLGEGILAAEHAYFLFNEVKCDPNEKGVLDF